MGDPQTPNPTRLPLVLDRFHHVASTSRDISLVSQKCESNTTYAQQNEDFIKGEVASWYRSQQCDDFWASKKYECQKSLPTANQLYSQLRTTDSSDASPSSDPKLFDTLVTVIALQLLASCSTFLPPSSAGNLPLYQQRTEHQLVSALQLNTQYRYAPAAGHHARAPSESSPWPGLCVLPASLRTPIDRRNHRKRRTNGGEYTPTFSGSGWTDGPTPAMSPEDVAHTGRGGQRSPPIDPHATEFAPLSPSSFTNKRTIRWDNSSSTSEAEPSLLSKLMCQPSPPKVPKRKPPGTGIVTRIFKGIPPPSDCADHGSGCRPPIRPKAPRRLQQLTQIIPSAIRLRRTQSAPRNAAKKDAQASEPPQPRRRSSNPSIRSPLTYNHQSVERSLTCHNFIIPQIRRTSATHTSANSTLRGSGRMSPPPDHLGDAGRQRIELWQSRALFPPREIKRTPPPSIREADNMVDTRRHSFPAVYTSQAHANARTAGILKNAGRRSSDVGFDDEIADQRLQRKNSHMSYDEAENSSDSELERPKKRKSVMFQDSPGSSAIEEMMGSESGEGKGKGK